MIGDTESICGLSALYMALENTVLTKSKLATQTYPDMRKAIFDEMNITQDDSKSDKDLLKIYFSGNFGYWKLMYIRV